MVCLYNIIKNTVESSYILCCVHNFITFSFLCVYAERTRIHDLNGEKSLRPLPSVSCSSKLNTNESLNECATVY